MGKLFLQRAVIGGEKEATIGMTCKKRIETRPNRRHAELLVRVADVHTDHRAGGPCGPHTLNALQDAWLERQVVVE